MRAGSKGRASGEDGGKKEHTVGVKRRADFIHIAYIKGCRQLLPSTGRTGVLLVPNCPMNSFIFTKIDTSVNTLVLLSNAK